MPTWGEMSWERERETDVGVLSPSPAPALGFLVTESVSALFFLKSMWLAVTHNQKPNAVRKGMLFNHLTITYGNWQHARHWARPLCAVGTNLSLKNKQWQKELLNKKQKTPTTRIKAPCKQRKACFSHILSLEVDSWFKGSVTGRISNLLTFTPPSQGTVTTLGITSTIGAGRIRAR